LHLLFPLIFKFPGTMGKNIRIFHIEIIYLIGGNITAVIVIILTKSTFELLFPFCNFSFEFLFNGVVFIQYWIKILLTQEEFGKLFHVTRQTVSNWENGKSYPDLQILVSMSNQFSSHPVLFKIK
jgi:DNA-binding XRE family transcriptional regulator